LIVFVLLYLKTRIEFKSYEIKIFVWRLLILIAKRL
jgi:hypothetical protein